MRVLFTAHAPWRPTGYGVPGFLIAEMWRGLGHETMFLAVDEYWPGILEWRGYPVATSAHSDGWGERTIAEQEGAWERRVEQRQEIWEARRQAEIARQQQEEDEKYRDV